MACQENVASEEYADFIARYYTSPAELKSSTGIDCIDFIDSNYAVIYAPRAELAAWGPFTLSYYTYTAIPKLYALTDVTAAEDAGIAAVLRLPAFSDGGEGVLIGFVDTGIDYRHPAFQNQYGKTRILGIWDQTLPPEESSAASSGAFFSPLYGVQFTDADINRALSSSDPYTIVPSSDENGHGTFLASVAAGTPDEENAFTGAAPRASIAMVKLRPAKQYLRDFFAIRAGAAAYQENDIMMGVSYLTALARSRSMPLVVCIGLGTGLGSHTGQLPLSNYLNEVAARQGNAVVVSAGNETGYGTHYRGTTDPENEYQDVELRVGEGCTGFSMELWAQDIGLYRIGFLSPTGETVMPLPTSTRDENAISFLLENTQIRVYYNISVASTGSQVIFVRFEDPLPGIWHLRIMSALDVSDTFHIWLPLHEFLGDGTYFLRPDPDTIITGPGNANYPLTVTACDPVNGAISVHASRGYSRTGQIKPELAAPGVGIRGAALPPASYRRMTGTSVSAAVAAGAAALFLRWGVLEGNDPYLSTISLKTWFIRGAQRNPGLSYPNREFGYGTLDLYSAFLSLRL